MSLPYQLRACDSWKPSTPSNVDSSLASSDNGAPGAPVTIGDVTVNPGDLIVGDIDGVVCVPQAVAAEVLALAQSIDSRELEQAKLIIQSGSLREGLAKYGRI